MRVLSILTILETAIAQDGTKNLSGEIRDTGALLNGDALAELEGQFDGIYAFLAFHPGADSMVTDYVRAGSLPDDSGNKVLVLFTVNHDAKWPECVDAIPSQSWLEVTQGDHLSYGVVKRLFRADQPPTLPGLLLFESLTRVTEPVFVPLGEAKSVAEIRQRLQTVFQLAASAHTTTHGSHFGETMDELCKGFVRKDIPYRRAGPRSLAEWLLGAIRLARKNAKDIVSVVQKFV